MIDFNTAYCGASLSPSFHSKALGTHNLSSSSTVASTELPRLFAGLLSGDSRSFSSSTLGRLDVGQIDCDHLL